jgi:PAS domain S-box-containing protein
MITLGMQAVMFANVIIAVVVASVILMLWYQTRNRYSGLSSLVIGCVLLAAGSLFIALRGMVPVWESVVLSNSMIIGGNLILFFGLSQFAGKKYNRILISLVWFLFMAFIAANIFFTYIHNDLTARIINFTIGLFLTCSMGIWLMFRGVKQEIRRISTGTGISFLGIGIILLIRLIAYSFNPPAGNDFLQSGTFETLFVMLLDGAIAVLVFNFVSMVNKRLLLEFQDKENAATKNANELQAIFKSTSVGFVILVNRVCKEVNDACCQMLGYSREEIIGRDSRPLYATEEEYVIVAQIYQEIAQHSSSTTEIRFLRKDGAKIHVIANIAALNNDDLSQGIIVSLIDITKRKQAEEALKLSEQNFRNSMDSSSIGIRISDLNGNNLYANQALLDIFGYINIDEIKANPPECFYSPDSKAGWVLHHKRLLSGQPIPKQIEVDITRRNSTIRHLQVSLKEVFWDGNQRFQTLYNDITEQKQAEEEKQRLEQKAEVAGRLAAMGEMAAGIAHEINNPLTGVLCFSQMILENENLPEDLKDDIRLIADSSQRVANIVKRLLTFAHQAKPTETLTNLNELIENTVKLREYVLKTNNIDLVFRLNPELPSSVVDPGQIQQVFLNLIVNAEQAMKEAHGKGTMYIRTEKYGNKIRISFRDDGPGITKDNLSHLFEPFFTTKAAGEGTGLGLSISRSIILAHDGTISVESKFGHGSTFIIELPIIGVAPEDAEASTQKFQVQSAGTIKSKILVIDDEPVVRNLFERILKRMGHSVDTFADARKAVEKLDAGATYDLIFTDIKMPGMSGIELYLRISKETPEMKNRIVFITGDVMGSDTKNFLVKNRLPYLTKPFDMGLLTKQINSVLINGQLNQAQYLV